EHHAGDAVGEADFDSGLAVMTIDAESGRPVGADAEAGAQGTGTIEDCDLRDASASDVELATGLAASVDQHELLRGDHAGSIGGVDGASGEDMAGHGASDEGGGESQGHKPDALFDGHGHGLLF